jgi:hypothetical protein
MTREEIMKTHSVIRTHPGIRIDQIPASGLPGLFFVAGTALLCLSIPAVQTFFLGSLTLGLIGAALMTYWRR